MVPYCGSFLPYMLQRFAGVLGILASMGIMETVDVQAEFEKLYFDIAEDPEPVALDMLCMVADDSRIVYGSDFPHSPAQVILERSATLTRIRIMTDCSRRFTVRTRVRFCVSERRNDSMEYTKLGNTDMNVSRICMGCMGFGDPSRGQHSWTIDEEHTREIIRRGLDLGVNFYDTAIAYQSGTSEQYVGRALRDFAKRDEVVVATKFLPRTQEELDAGVTGQRHIENMINASLKNLGMDYVDLYIYHMWDWQTPTYDILDGLNRVVKAGKVRYIGISNCFAWQLAKANALAEKEGFAKFVSIQGHYNLLFREEEREMVPLCAEDSIALTPYSTLASGRLSRRPGEDTKRAREDSYAKFKYDATKEQDAVIIQRVAEIADKRGVTMTEVSLAWLLTKVTAPVVGATKHHHIEGAAKAVDLHLSDEECVYLEEPYVPHPLVGVMAQNKPESAKEKHVWSTGDQKI